MTKENVSIIIAFTVIVLGFGLIGAVGFEKHEEVRCYELKTQSEEYPNFFLTKFEKAMCDAHGIEINAEVK